MKTIDTKSWAEFKVGDLFELSGVKQAKSQRLIPTKQDGIPYVVQSQSNNMVSRRVDKKYLLDNDEPICKGNVIVLGVTLPAVSYQPTEFGASQVITAYNEHLTEGVGLYLAVLLKKQMCEFSYTNKPGISKYKELRLKLPIQQVLDPDKTYHPEGYIPDWDYMEAFIEGINQQAQARLNEYKEGKLEYTTLDSKIGYTPVDTKSWAEFKVGDLFDVRPTKAYKLNRHDLIDNGPNPVLANSSHNNGISGYTTLECTEKGGFISFSDTTSGGDTMFYQPVPVVGYSHVQGMFPIDVELNEYKAQYLISVIRAHLGGTWNYINKLTRKHMEKLKIQLPVDSTGQPDWDYMEAFMKQINQQAQAKLDTLEKGKA